MTAPRPRWASRPLMTNTTTRMPRLARRELRRGLFCSAVLPPGGACGGAGGRAGVATASKWALALTCVKLGGNPWRSSGAHRSSSAGLSGLLPSVRATTGVVFALVQRLISSTPRLELAAAQELAARCMLLATTPAEPRARPPRAQRAVEAFSSQSGRRMIGLGPRCPAGGLCRDRITHGQLLVRASLLPGRPAS